MEVVIPTITMYDMLKKWLLALASTRLLNELSHDVPNTKLPDAVSAEHAGTAYHTRDF